MTEPVQEILSLDAMRRAAFSVGLILLYLIGCQIPIPFLSFSEGLLGTAPQLSLFRLGFNALVVGFLLVELFSLLIPAGQRLRRRGVQGRRTLQRAAFGVSLLVVGVQAFGIHQFFLQLEMIDTSRPSLSGLWMIVSLTGGAALLYWLADKATDLGLVNGFCLLLGYEVVTRFLWSSQDVGEPAGLEPGPWALAISWALVVATVVGVWRFLISPATLAVSDTELETLRVEVPPFVASIVPATIVVGFLNYLTSSSWVGRYLGLPESPVLSGGLVLLFIGIGIPILSWLGFRMFSHWKRFESSLIPPTAGILGDAREVLRQRLLVATLILTAGPLAFGGLYWFTSLPLTESLFFTQVVLLTALVVDLVDQVRLSRRGETVKLLDLDNVHLAAYLKALFRSEGIDLEIQAYHFRRLLFFFGPLFKMQMRVAREDEQRAWKVLEGQEVAVI